MAQEPEVKKEAEAATPTGEETTTPHVEEVTTEETVPEGMPERLAVESDMEAFLKDEADDLDADATPAEVKTEETPPEGPTPKEEAKEETPPVEATPEAAPAPSPAEPKPAEVPPTAAPTEVVVPEPTPPVAPVAAPAEPAQPTPTPTPAAEPTPPTMDQVRATYQENRKALEDQIASNVYNLSEEQVQQLDDGDSSIIPKLAARVYMDAVTGAVAHMITYLPQMVNEALAGRDKQQEWSDKFYAANPALNKDAHGAVVDRLGASYRGMYPVATSEEFIRDVGAQAMVALKVLPGGNGEIVPAPVVPIVPVVPAPKTPPFSPASAGGTGGGAAPPPANPYEALAEAMDPAEELDVD